MMLEYNHDYAIELLEAEKYDDLYEYLMSYKDNNNSDVLTFISDCYNNGFGVKENKEQAFYWLKKAAELEDGNAQYYLGLAYSQGNGVKKDAEQALFWLEKSVKKGNSDAIEPYTILKKIMCLDWYKQGFAYFYGINCEKDVYEACKCFFKSAEYGCPEAQYYLGVCYFKGYGIEKNHVKAFEWFSKSAEQGCAEAQNNVGVFYLNGIAINKDEPQAVYWFKKSAEQNFDEAQFNLAACYNDGCGVKQNKEQAFYWFKKAAEQGNSNAQENLGIYLYNGEGVEKDHKQSFVWLQKSAEQGKMHAQFLIGLFYFLGDYFDIDIEENLEKAYDWFQKAAKQGHKEAERILSSGTIQLCLGLEYLTDMESISDEQQAFDLFEIAAELGDAEAQFLLGLFCLTDKHYNAEKSFKNFEKSANQGNVSGQTALSICYNHGVFVEKNQKIATQWLSKAYEKDENTELVDNVLKMIQFSSNEKSASGFETADLIRHIEVLEENNKKMLQETQFLKELFSDAISNLTQKIGLISQDVLLAQSESHRMYDTLNQIKENTDIIPEINEKLQETANLIAAYIKNKKAELPSEKVQKYLSEEELEQLRSDFIKESAEQISNLLKESKANTLSEEKYLQGLFGKYWDDLDAYTQTALISARTFLSTWNTNAHEKLDFSGIVISATSALENELKKRFFDGYQKYLYEKVGEPDYTTWPESMIFKGSSYSKCVKNNIFTLGSLPHIFGVNRSSPNCERDRKMFNEYLKSIMSDSYKSSGILAFTYRTDNNMSIIDKCEEVRKNYRNEAAHTKAVNKETANKCCDIIIGYGECSENIGKIQGLLFEIVKMTDNFHK